MPNTATFVKVVRSVDTPERFLSQHLYKLSDPVQFDADDEIIQTDYVVVSASHIVFDGRDITRETYIFPADEQGNVVDWTELRGSMRGTLDHSAALMAGGYTLTL